jgi:hypothetical protein
MAGPQRHRTAKRRGIECCQQLVTLAVLSWLYASAWEVLMDALFTWRFTDPDGPLRRLDFPLQTALTGMAIAALLTRPLHRVFGAQASAAALLIAAPIVVLTCLESLSVVTRWTDRPLSNAIQAFDAVFPLLLLMQACVWLEHRSPAAAAHAETHRALGDQLGHLFDRVPSWFARSAVAPLLVLTAFTVALRGWLEGSGDVPPVLSAITTLLVPICTLLLTAAAIHEHRKRRAARRSRTWCGRTLGHRILSPLAARRSRSPGSISTASRPPSRTRCVSTRTHTPSSSRGPVDQ